MAGAGTGGIAGKAGGAKLGRGVGAKLGGGLTVGGGGGDERKVTGISVPVGGRMLTGLGCTGTGTDGGIPPGRGAAPGPPARSEIGGIWMRAVFFVTASEGFEAGPAPWSGSWMRWLAVEGPTGAPVGGIAAAPPGGMGCTGAADMRVTALGPLSRILPPATEARTVEGGRLPGLIGPVAGVPAAGTCGRAGTSSGTLGALIVEICPVRWAGRTGKPAAVSSAESAESAGLAGRMAPATVPTAVGRRSLSSFATCRKGVSISPTLSSRT